MGKVANAAEGVDCKREELGTGGIEGCNGVTGRVMLMIATEFALCFLIVPVCSGNRIWGDTLRRRRGGWGDDDIDGESLGRERSRCS